MSTKLVKSLNPSKPAWRRLITVAAASVVLVTETFAQSGSFDWGTATQLGSYPGILRSQSGAVNCLRIDLTTPNLRLFTTGQSPYWQDNTLREAAAKTTADFVREMQGTCAKVVAAINADAFSRGTYDPMANLRAYNVSEGVKVSSGNIGGNAATLIVSNSGAIDMRLTSSTSEPDISQIRLAVSGFNFVLQNGVPTGDNVTLAQRTGLGMSADGRYVYFFTYVGGNGCSIYAVGDWLRYYGAATGINMDGGGSSQMCWWNASTGAAEYLSATQTRLLGNNLGVYYYETPTLPLPWMTFDVGSVGLNGSCTASGGVYTVAGAGAGIAGTADAFRLVCNHGPAWPLATNTTYGIGGPVARLVSQSGTTSASIAGVMIRDDDGSDFLNTGTQYAFIGRRGDGKVLAQWRAKLRGRPSSVLSATVVPPNSWFRIRRTGLSGVSMEYSTDGTNWNVVTSQSISLGQYGPYMPVSGLVVSSGSSSVLDTATFSNVAAP